MQNKILEAYLKLRSQLDAFSFDRLNVVIIAQPRSFNKLMAELNGNIRRDFDVDCYYIPLASRWTPILIDNKLPENVEFQIMTQKDYERIEQEKMLDRFYKMFERQWY